MGLAQTINKLSASKDFGNAFIESMDMAIKLQATPHVSRANIKPSKAHCMRQMFYILKSEPVDGAESVDPDMTLIQAEGTAMHGIIQDILGHAMGQGIEFVRPELEVAKAQQMGIRTEVRRTSMDDETPYEVTCYNKDYDISFKFDGVIRFQNKKVILEIKNEDHFKWLKRVGPEPEHVLQATLYSLCLGIEQVLFLYVDRNYKKRKAYLIEITDEMRQTQVTRIRLAQTCKIKNIVPGKEEGKVCRYCNHKKACKREGDQSHEGLITINEALGINVQK